MSRDVYGSGSQVQRSPKPSRQPEMAASLGQGVPPKSTVYASISQPPSARGSPISSRNLSSPSQPRRVRHYGISRSSNSSPLTLPHDQYVPQSISSSAFNVGHSYYGDEIASPSMDPRAAGSHRSRSATRAPLRSYHSIDRDQDREFLPIHEPRERSLDRAELSSRHARNRSLERSGYRDEHLYRDRETAIDGDPYREPHMHRSSHAGDSRYSRDSFIMELQSRLNELQSQYGNVKRELDATTQKLGSSMHSIKTFWSPELKKERALRKEEAAKYALINDQLKILRSENQKQSSLIRQLEEELRLAHMRNPDAELQQHLDALYAEKEHMSKEIFLLRETIKELELRIETQKQTLASRDESIKKLMEMLQSKGVGGQVLEEQRIEMERLKSRLIETEARSRHLETMLETRERDIGKLDEVRIELNKRDQEVLAMGAKMRTLEEQHQDYQRHIAVLKESLCAKEEHYNMLQADVEELRQRLEEKNKLIEKKTQQAMTATQERNHLSQEMQELRDHMDIKDRKINVLQRKIENLEDLLKEKDNQVDMARARLTAIQAHHSTSEGALSSLEEAISDKDKQISQLREQRDRAEQERNEERELHEREIAEYKMKMHSLESEMEKLQNDLQKLRSRPPPGQGNPQQEAELSAMKKQLEDKHKSLEDLEKKLKKRKDKLDHMEASLQQAAAAAGGGSSQNEQILAKQVEDLRKHCSDLEKSNAQLEKKAKESAGGAPQEELERLLQIMSTLEEEKFNLNKQIKELQDALKDKEMKLNSMKRNQQSDKTRSAHMLEEARRREGELSKEASKAQDVVEEQRDRIEELEEALRESVKITAESESEVVHKKAVIKAAEEKIVKLTSEVRALHNAHNARCTNCPSFKVQLGNLEEKYQKLVSERRKHLEELFEMKLEAMSAAVSEKDAHLALLEMSGIKNAQTAEEVDRLKTEKRKLVERIKTENDRRVKTLMELGDLKTEKNGDIENSKNKAGQPQADVEDDGLRS